MTLAENAGDTEYPDMTDAAEYARQYGSDEEVLNEIERDAIGYNIPG
jgi:hypothetical protein